jgi:hypothetical protein
MNACEFMQMGYRVALMPSSVPLAAVTAARELLLELQQSARDQDYFARQAQFVESERWYRNLAAAAK